MVNKKNLTLIIAAAATAFICLSAAGVYFFWPRPEVPAIIVQPPEKISQLSAEEKARLGISPDAVATAGQATEGGEGTVGQMPVVVIRPNQQTLDSDGDGLSDEMEKQLGTDSRRRDTDGDGVEDGDETRIGSNPLESDNPFKE